MRQRPGGQWTASSASAFTVALADTRQGVWWNAHSVSDQEASLRSKRSPLLLRMVAGLGLPQALDEADTSRAATWVWVSQLSLSCAFGLLLVALAYAGARRGASWADLVYWVGLLIQFVPIAARLLSPRATRNEHLSVLTLLGITLYLVSAMQYPLGFTDYDAFLHLRTAQDIVGTHHLFSRNPILPVSPSYPGIEIVTTALSSVSGMSIYSCGLFVVGAARTLFVLSLYLFIERVSGLPRMAALTTLLYMTNSAFVSFDVQFAYESLALPLGMWVLFATSAHVGLSPSAERRGRQAHKATPWRRRSGSAGVVVAIISGIAATVVTHHVTSYIVVMFLWAWSLAYLLQGGRLLAWESPIPGAICGALLSSVWILATHGQAITYLSSSVSDAFGTFMQTLTGHSSMRPLFQSGAKQVAPSWERISLLASLALVGFGLVVGLPGLWYRYRHNSAALILGAAAVAYPLSQTLRLTEAGTQVVTRVPEFLFWGVGFAIACAIFEVQALPSLRWWRPMFAPFVIVPAVAITLVGSVVDGVGPSSSRLPGPYQVMADARSITPEGVDAAAWASVHLGPNHRVGTDRINTILMGTYGRQWPVTTLQDHVQIAAVFTSTELWPAEQAILRNSDARYLVVDERLSRALPQNGYYFTAGEDNAYHYTSPLNLAALLKFDHINGVSRIYDGGNIIIYDVGVFDAKK